MGQEESMDNAGIWGCIPRERRRRVFFSLLGITLTLMISMQLIGSPLQTGAAPAGIISFEFAGNLTTADNMLDSWGSQGQAVAGLSLGLDYLFLVAYSITIALGCIIVAGNLHSRFNFLSRIGILLSWAQFLAALLDALENYALIRVLLGSDNALWSPVALWSAVPKFALVALGILYVLIGALIILLSGRRSAQVST
jgi:hypothetical protein